MLAVEERRNAYRQLCRKEGSIPIFSRDWWLDALCGESGWDVVLVQRGGRIVAAMPYAIKRRYGFTILTQPVLTPSLGPWIADLSGKNANILAAEKDIMGELVDKLPPFDHYTQNWSKKRRNWIPFFWKGFTQTTKYTYVLDKIDKKDEIWRNMRGNIKTDIKKSRERFKIIVKKDADLDDFWNLNKMVFERRGKAMPYTREVVGRLDSACASRNCRKIFVAEDSEGRRHAGVYIVWDKNSAYYLMGGGDPKLRNSGATSLCMWEAICFASTVTRSFDFEGSMIEPVERFFRAFGAKQVPYFSVSKTPSRLLRAAFAFRDVVRSP